MIALVCGKKYTFLTLENIWLIQLYFFKAKHLLSNVSRVFFT